MGKTKTKKVAKPKSEEYYHVLSGKRGFLKVSYHPLDSGDQFSMAFGRSDKFCQDNGRILGYDTRHGHDPLEYGPCHRHYLAKKEAFHLSEYQLVYGIFSTQWPKIDVYFKHNDSLDNFHLTE